MKDSLEKLDRDCGCEWVVGKVDVLLKLLGGQSQIPRKYFRYGRLKGWVRVREW